MPETGAGPFLIYGAAWLSFGFLHSFLAGDRLTPLCGAYTRFIYNGISVFHILGVFFVGRWVFSGVEPFNMSDTAGWVLRSAHVAGWILFVAALRYYDLGLLAGTKQIRRARAGKPVPDIEPLHLTGFHRYVRHPLYAAAFIILWTAAMSPYGLATALWGTLYLLAGTYFEERRLVRLYGEPYETYRKQVPAFLPWRGRVI